MHADSRVPGQFSGIIAVDKPQGKSSAEVVNRIKRILRHEAGQKIRVGHAGTLDPLATGVLLVCCGLATKLVPYLHEFSKSYLAGFTLGQRSDTDDSEGTITLCLVSEPVPDSKVREGIDQFRGEILQKPPAFSAIRIAGKRAYDLARRGKLIDLPSRLVTIHDIRLVESGWPRIQVSLDCSSGTYIRSIARDLGDTLGCGAYMHSLVRTRIGPFGLEGCTTISNLATAELRPLIRSAKEAFPGVPCVSGGEQDLVRLRDGKSFVCPGNGATRIVVTDSNGGFVAMLEQSPTVPGEFVPGLNWAPVLFSSRA